MNNLVPHRGHDRWCGMVFSALAFILLVPNLGVCGEVSRAFKADSVRQLVVDGAFGDVVLDRTDGTDILVQFSGNVDTLNDVSLKNDGGALILATRAVSVTQKVNGGTIVNIAEGGATASVTVGGKSIEAGEDIRGLNVRISLPKKVALVASGMRSVDSNARFSSIKLDIAGKSVLSFKDTGASRVSMDVSGKSHVFVSGVQNGSIEVDALGKNSISFSGVFSMVSAELTGSTSLVTRGDVLGDYSVDLTGASSVTHYGAISGRISKDMVGKSSFRQVRE